MFRPEYLQLIDRYIIKSGETIRFYGIKEGMIEAYQKSNTRDDIYNALFDTICQNTYVLFCDYRNKKGKIIPNNKHTNHKNIVSVKELRPSLIKVLPLQEYKEFSDWNDFSNENQTLFLEETLWKEVIQISGVPNDDAIKEIENLKIYRDKCLAHADSNLPGSARYPETARLARLAYGFNVIVDQISSALHGSEPRKNSFEGIVDRLKEDVKNLTPKS